MGLFLKLSNGTLKFMGKAYTKYSLPISLMIDLRSKQISIHLKEK